MLSLYVRDQEPWVKKCNSKKSQKSKVFAFSESHWSVNYNDYLNLVNTK
jgi:hypothetical protein